MRYGLLSVYSPSANGIEHGTFQTRYGIVTASGAAMMKAVAELGDPYIARTRKRQDMSKMKGVTKSIKPCQ